MDVSFPLYYCNRAVGEAHCKREGLYYHFSCIVKLKDRKLYRVIVESDSYSLDLGICVPNNDHFTLSKRVSIKTLKGEPQSFRLICQADKDKKIPVYEDQEFSCIERLTRSRYFFQNGISYIIIPQL